LPETGGNDQQRQAAGKDLPFCAIGLPGETSGRRQRNNACDGVHGVKPPFYNIYQMAVEWFSVNGDSFFHLTTYVGTIATDVPCRPPQETSTVCR